MKRTGLVLLVVAIVGVLGMPTASAVTRYPTSCTEHFVAQPVEGRYWIEEGVLHGRGAVFVYDVVGDPYCAGALTVVVNLNLDLTDWSGALWGTGMVELDAFNGGFASLWTAHWTTSNPLAPDATDIWSGRSTGSGFGELEGWQVRATMVEMTHLLVVEEGYAFAPAS